MVVGGGGEGGDRVLMWKVVVMKTPLTPASLSPGAEW